MLGLFALATLPAVAGAAEQNAKPNYIGQATMAADGTVDMHLYRTSDGIPADGDFRYKVNHPDYQAILDHLGGMKPGETKLVPAWPDPPDKN
jgi:hypothetical protein